MSLSKSQAVQMVREHYKKNNNIPKHAATGELVPLDAEDLPVLLQENERPFEQPEEIALIQIGLKLGVFALEDLDEECRNLIGEL